VAENSKAGVPYLH